MIFAAGEQIGRYKLIRRLGGGGMGEVYLAHLEGAAGFVKEVALKLIRADRAHSTELARLFMREGRALAALRHRNVVQVFELDSDGEQLYLAMEYLQGIDAQRLLARSGALPWPAVAFIGAEIARGLAAAHQLKLEEARVGLVHGDVSPANVMLCNDGAVKLLDFGVARPARREVTFAGTRGKLAYLPPEAVNGMPPDARTDLYSLAVVLYELATGKNPFRGSSDLDTYQRIMTESVAPMGAVDPAFERLVLQALARDRAARPGSAAAFADQLDAIQARQFSSADVASLVARTEGRVSLSETPPPESTAPTSVMVDVSNGPHTEAETPPISDTDRTAPPPRRWIAIASASIIIGVGLSIGFWPANEQPVRPAPAPNPPPASAPAPASASAPAPDPSPNPPSAPAPASASAPSPSPSPSPARHPKRVAKRPPVAEKRATRPEKPGPEKIDPTYIANPFEDRR